MTDGSLFYNIHNPNTMKKITLTTLIATVVFILSVINVQAANPDFSMIGFATLNGGTTGGEGGETVTVKTFAELKQYAENANIPYIIQIDGEINTGITAHIEKGTGKIATSGSTETIETTYGEVIKIGSNKTLIGIGDKAFLNRIGLNVQCQSNIIIRNIKFTMQDVPIDKSGENKIVGFRNGAEILLGDPDCISIQADNDNLPKADRYSKNIWIDHCEFYNYPLTTEHKDRYDGLVDIKNDVQFVTISWCHFHDHSKACLFGKGSSDDFNRTTTMHHNYFEDIKGSRLPLLRHGQHHYFNNYMYGCEDGLNVRINSNAYIESCYFEDTKSPIFGKTGDSPSGKATLKDNIFKGCKNLPAGNENIDGAKFSELKADLSFEETDFNPSAHYNYSALLDNAEEVPAIVKEYAGVGKISDNLNSIQSDQTQLASVIVKGKRITVTADNGSNVKIYTTNGKLLTSKTVSGNEEIFPINQKGIYLVQVKSNNQVQNIKVII